MSRFTACYDIADHRTRRNVARILLGFGRRVQESVFELQLDPDDLRELKATVGAWLAKTDRFDLYPIDTRRPKDRISWQRSPRPAEIVFVGPFLPPPAEPPPDSAESGGSASESPSG